MAWINPHKCEEYLQILPHNLALAVAKIRLSNINIDSVRSRMYGVRDHSIEKCALCGTYTICDEYHYLVKCPKLEKERLKCEPFFADGYRDLKSIRYLLNCDNEAVAIFCKQINKSIKGKMSAKKPVKNGTGGESVP